MNRAEVDVEVIPAEKRLGGGGAGGGWKVGMEPIELIEGEWVGLVDMVGRNIATQWYKEYMKKIWARRWLMGTGGDKSGV